MNSVEQNLTCPSIDLLLLVYKCPRGTEELLSSQPLPSQSSLLSYGGLSSVDSGFWERGDGRAAVGLRPHGYLLWLMGLRVREVGVVEETPAGRPGARFKQILGAVEKGDFRSHQWELSVWAISHGILKRQSASTANHTVEFSFLGYYIYYLVLSTFLPSRKLMGKNEYALENREKAFNLLVSRNLEHFQGSVKSPKCWTLPFLPRMHV